MTWPALLRDIQVHEQQEWDFEYVHQKTGEQRWFHIIAMGSEVNGKKKYILAIPDKEKMHYNPKVTIPYNRNWVTE